MPRTLRVIYLFDPLCGWCYGAAPLIEALAERSVAQVDFVPMGLFAGEAAAPITPAMAEHIRAADTRIAQVSGQPFSDAYLVNILNMPSARLDSGPATLGLTAVRLDTPAGEGEALRAIQHARYVRGLDTADGGTVASVLGASGFTAAAARLHAPDAELLAANAYRLGMGRNLMQRFSLNGVPALLAELDGAISPVPASLLFGSVEDLLGALS